MRKTVGQWLAIGSFVLSILAGLAAAREFYELRTEIGRLTDHLEKLTIVVEQGGQERNDSKRALSLAERSLSSCQMSTEAALLQLRFVNRKLGLDLVATRE